MNLYFFVLPVNSIAMLPLPRLLRYASNTRERQRKLHFYLESIHYPNIINLHITDENINDSPVSIYDIEGRKQQNLRSGFNIMKTRNGKTVKVIH